MFTELVTTSPQQSSLQRPRWQASSQVLLAERCHHPWLPPPQQRRTAACELQWWMSPPCTPAYPKEPLAGTAVPWGNTHSWAGTWPSPGPLQVADVTHPQRNYLPGGKSEDAGVNTCICASSGSYFWISSHFFGLPNACSIGLLRYVQWPLGTRVPVCSPSPCCLSMSHAGIHSASCYSKHKKQANYTADKTPSFSCIASSIREKSDEVYMHIITIIRHL